MGNVQSTHTWEYAKRLNVLPPCDVVVAGGGIAGTMAAIAAARTGAEAAMAAITKRAYLIQVCPFLSSRNCRAAVGSQYCRPPAAGQSGRRLPHSESPGDTADPTRSPMKPGDESGLCVLDTGDARS